MTARTVDCWLSEDDNHIVTEFGIAGGFESRWHPTETPNGLIRPCIHLLSDMPHVLLIGTPDFVDQIPVGRHNAAPLLTVTSPAYASREEIDGVTFLTLAFGARGEERHDAMESCLYRLHPLRWTDLVPGAKTQDDILLGVWPD